MKRKVNNIIIHCTAGYSGVTSIEKFWRRAKKDGGAGWLRSKGYNIIVDLEGKLWFLTDPFVESGGYKEKSTKATFETVTNGVAGFNSDAINISYIGGVLKDNVNKASDSRTQKQKEGIIQAINISLAFLEKHQDISKIKIKGHRDFSPDKNGNGIVDSWERIKECPSFDAIPEYKFIMSSTNLALL